MKTLSTLILTLLVCFSAHAQHQIVSLLEGPQNFKINGGARAQFGGKSRIVVPVQVPANAVYMYYSVSTKAGSDNSFPQAVQLTAQLMSLVPSTATLPLQGLAALAGKVAVANRESAVDFYILPTWQDANNFQAKLDGSWKVINYRENFLGGAIGVKRNTTNEDETIYIGIKNPSSMYSVLVSIEAAGYAE